MRYIVILSGIPGSGKSYFIKEHSLEGYTLTPDSLRLDLRSPDLNLDGQLEIIQNHNVFDELDRRIESRMKRGEYIVIDATHTRAEYFKKYQQMAYRHRYQLLVVSFAAVPLETCLERNQQRSEYKIVPDTVIRRFSKQITELSIPQKVEVITPDQYADYHGGRLEDFSHYRKIHHIGDIQGVDSVLETYFDRYRFSPDEAYIFVGDLIDRGAQNGEVVIRMLDLLRHENVYLIEGNHDTYLWEWSNNRPVSMREFNLRTKPQLESIEISKAELAGRLRKMLPYLYYEYRGRKVLVTHGGISCVPVYPHLVSDYTYIHGTGKYIEVGTSDDNFTRSVDANTFQIHGHRNKQQYPIEYNSQVFNLEGRVEFGGSLRVVQLLSEEGFNPIEIATKDSTIEVEVDTQNQLIVEELRNNTFIKEKRMNILDSISSLNFTKDAFFKKEWNQQTTTARGLFINNQNYQVVIRSYNKFFNIGERPETHLRTLENTFQFPVKAWVKENGYLGLLGYDKAMDRLVFASKSTTEGDFAGWFEERFYETVGVTESEDIKEILKELDISLVFEVVEPIKDPHIIEEENSKLVLLDAVKRTFTFSKLSDQETEAIAAKFNFTYKKLAKIIDSKDELSDWYETVTKADYLHKGKPIEGFVLEADDGFHVKIKLDYYAFWKQMRTLMERVYKGKSIRFEKMLYEDAAREFAAFLQSEKEQGVYYSDIISARKVFEAS